MNPDILDRALAIHGWMDPAELEWIHEHARGQCAEIGVYRGRTTAVMTKVASLLCVDEWHFNGDGVDVTFSDGDVFFDNLKTFPHRNRITVFPLSSVVAAYDMPDVFFDFVFIDAAHDYSSISADIRAWLPKVRPGGILAGHDYNQEWLGVVRAVCELLPAHEFPVPGGCIWAHRKDGTK
jgi:hypothetical protein